MRGAFYAVGFLVVMAVMGLVKSPWGVLALPAAVLVGFAFAAVGMACSTFMRSWQDLDLVTLATLPLFLFSATFFPLAIYPTWLQVVARFSPLYHGIELIRGLTLGILDITMIGHAAVLVAMGTIGLAVAGRRISKLLLV
jgi:lipooligosaccharide transport system permease protein